MSAVLQAWRRPRCGHLGVHLDAAGPFVSPGPARAS
jgi:hypothetical protein